jgi:hypothetical protein
LAGTITNASDAIIVTLERPGSRHIARALELLADQINTEPPHMPGDRWLITYKFASARI